MPSIFACILEIGFSGGHGTAAGMQSGVTAIGLMLLKLIDTEHKTGTAETFGMKLMIYVAFLGGGILTVLFPLKLVYFGVWWTTLSGAIIMLIFFIASILSAGQVLGKNKNTGN